FIHSFCGQVRAIITDPHVHATARRATTLLPSTGALQGIAGMRAAPLSLSSRIVGGDLKSQVALASRLTMI
ncbi:hypothetical protein, partial [Candidatus Competibacter phosphatis]|uniref:hypothetical protein n=1 Tax=Candidatus Competibacter phosphatis TaxID=221280 RepID=UPI001B7E109F